MKDNQYRMGYSDELMEFLWIRPVHSGLNIDIFVDDSGSYIRNNRNLLLFARNGYDKAVSTFLPFSISNNPVILDDGIDCHISDNDIAALKEFIAKNHIIIELLADGIISHESFINAIKGI